MNNELYHFGVKGMKWGVRRSIQQLGYKQAHSKTGQSGKRYKVNRANNEINSEGKKGLSRNQKTAIKVGVAVVSTALATYGTYKAHEFVRTRHAEIEFGKQFLNIQNNAIKTAGSYGNYREGYKKAFTEGRDAVKKSADRDSFAKAVRNVVENKRKKGTRLSLNYVDYL